MRTEIRSNRLVIHLDDANQHGHEVVAKDRASGAEIHLDAQWRDTGGGGAEFSLAIPDYNAAQQGLYLKSPSGDITDLNSAVAHFLLDMQQVTDHGYMTRNIFGAGIRNLSGDDLMYLLYCNLDVLDPNNQFFGGLVTVLSFRIAEDLESRQELLPKVIDGYRRMEEQQVQRADHSIRWRMSSAVNLAILLLYLERTNEARALVVRAVAREPFNTMFPLTFMNQATLLALDAMLALDAGNRSRAYMLFSECSGVCNNAVTDLFSLRNNYFFQHEQDVRTLIEIGYQSAYAMAALAPPRHPDDSKMTMDVKQAPFQRVTFAPVFSRFKSILNRLPSVAERSAHTIKTLGAAR